MSSARYRPFFSLVLMICLRVRISGSVYISCTMHLSAISISSSGFFVLISILITYLSVMFPRYRVSPQRTSGLPRYVGNAAFLLSLIVSPSFIELCVLRLFLSIPYPQGKNKHYFSKQNRRRKPRAAVLALRFIRPDMCAP